MIAVEREARLLPKVGHAASLAAPAKGPTMPALIPTVHVAEVVWLGVTPDRSAALQSAPREVCSLSFAGPEGEDHAGLTRPSDSRVWRNTRAAPRSGTCGNCPSCRRRTSRPSRRYGPCRPLPPIVFGATMVLRGIPDFTRIPPSSRLQDEDSGTTLTVDMENRPCHLVSKEIEALASGLRQGLQTGGHGAARRDGLGGAGGRDQAGRPLRLHIPDQPEWPHARAARGA
jgi:hypothetical protein